VRDKNQQKGIYYMNDFTRIAGKIKEKIEKYFLQNALSSDEKTKERARLRVEKNVYGI